MRTKNRPLLLTRALNSVAGQTFQNWQLVVVNDGGCSSEVDAAVGTLPATAIEKITVLHHKDSLGMEAASNAGLAKLTTDYVHVHDDDDSLHREFYAQVIEYFETTPHPKVRGVVTGTERIIETIRGDQIHEIKRRTFNDNVRTISLRRLLSQNLFAPIAFVFDRKAGVEVGGFREDLPVLGDWEFNIRFLLKYEIGTLRNCLAYYHDREKDHTSAYASSVTGRAELHAFYDNFLRNEWLRQDIAAGRFGIGFLAVIAPLLYDLRFKIRNPFKRLLGR